MNRLKLWVGIILLLVLGALAGSLVTGVLVKKRIVHFREGKPGDRKAFFLNKLTRELDLTEEQRIKIGEIMDKTHEKLEELRDKHHPEFKKIREESFELMRKELNEEQKQKLDELRKKFRKRFKKGRRPPPPPPGEGPPPPLP
jgi:Spy/CpxP family protein refolding chaperone